MLQRRLLSQQQSAAPHSAATPQTSPEELEAARLERISVEERAGYLREHRALSTELHGFSYTTDEELTPPSAPPAPPAAAAMTSVSSAFQQQQQQDNNAYNNSGSSIEDYSTPDVGVSVRDVEAARTKSSALLAAAATRNSNDDTNSHSGVRELMAPMGTSLGNEPLTLAFGNLSVWAPVNPKKPSLFSRAWSKAVSCGKAESNPQRQILFDVTGQVRPGEVLALMGPSGSGKTSLLTVLGGRSPMRYKGEVTVNGQPYSKATRKRIGFVLQDDVLFESLTVKETLTYAALLRLPGSMSKKQKLDRVDTVLEALGLGKSKDTIIGGFFRRGISGGERKRVSIGHELLINPAIIMLDEPTSGLDSTTAMHLLSLLQDLAAGGRSVATTIHQPSSRLYQKLDWLMLLAEGHLMYYGKADQVLDWFGGFGYQIPFGVSIADFILDVSLGEAGYSASGNTGAAAIKELYTAFETRFGGAAKQGGNYFSSSSSSSKPGGHQRQLPMSIDGGVGEFDSPRSPHGVSNGVVGSNGSSIQQPYSQRQHLQQQQPEGVDSSSSSKQHSKSGSKDRASYWQQMRVLLQRSARVRRFEEMTGQHFFQLFAVAFITGLVWWQRGQDYYGGLQAASDILGLLFFILLFPSMRSLFRALFTFPNERRMLLKERPSGMYNLSAYYIARTFSDIPAEMLNTLLFVVIAYWFGGLRHDAGAFFGLLFSLVLVVLTAESWGLLIGGIFMDAKTAQTVTTVVILTFLLVGGYYVRNIPVWISWIRYLSFLYWGNNLLLKSQFNGVTFYQCGGATGSCTPVSFDQLNLLVNPSDPAYPEVLILLAMLIFLRLVIYYVLRQKTKVVQRKMK